MTTRAGISINTSPVADAYSDRNRERRIEFSSPVGGGLISFSYTPDNQLSVHVYRQDMTVAVTAGEPGEPVASGNLRMDRALYLAAKAYAAAWEARNTINPHPSAFSCAWCDADIEQAAIDGGWYDVATAQDGDGLPSPASLECDEAPDGVDTPSKGHHVPGGEWLLREARGWIADTYPEVDVTLLSDRSVIEGVQRTYEGGWAAFVAASPA